MDEVKDSKVAKPHGGFLHVDIHAAAAQSMPLSKNAKRHFRRQAQQTQQNHPNKPHAIAEGPQPLHAMYSAAAPPPTRNVAEFDEEVEATVRDFKELVSKEQQAEQWFNELRQIPNDHVVALKQMLHAIVTVLPNRTHSPHATRLVMMRSDLEGLVHHKLHLGLYAIAAWQNKVGPLFDSVRTVIVDSIVALIKQIGRHHDTAQCLRGAQAKQCDSQQETKGLLGNIVSSPVSLKRLSITAQQYSHWPYREDFQALLGMANGEHGSHSVQRSTPKLQQCQQLLAALGTLVAFEHEEPMTVAKIDGLLDRLEACKLFPLRQFLLTPYADCAALLSFDTFSKLTAAFHWLSTGILFRPLAKGSSKGSAKNLAISSLSFRVSRRLRSIYSHVWTICRRRECYIKHNDWKQRDGAGGARSVRTGKGPGAGPCTHRPLNVHLLQETTNSEKHQFHGRFQYRTIYRPTATSPCLGLVLRYLWHGLDDRRASSCLKQLPSVDPKVSTSRSTGSTENSLFKATTTTATNPVEFRFQIEQVQLHKLLGMRGSANLSSWSALPVHSAPVFISLSETGQCTLYTTIDDLLGATTVEDSQRESVAPSAPLATRRQAELAAMLCQYAKSTSVL